MKLDEEDIDAIADAVTERARKEIRRFFWGFIAFCVVVWICQRIWPLLFP
jgi:hypothetical protein